MIPKRKRHEKTPETFQEYSKPKISKILILHLLTLVCCLLPPASQANNVSIINTSVTGSDLSFDLSWDNSWRVTQPPYSHDAIWVFVKYADCSGSVQVWQHANLSTVATDHTSPATLEIETVTDGKGVFIKRSASNPGGPSNIATSSITIKLNIPLGTYNFKVFGVEMVNVPQGDFQIGDGTSTSTFNSITITAGNETGGLSAAALYAASPAVPAAYPVGWSSFYCMKYEITQEEYVDFLNTLTYDQQATRTHTLCPPNSASRTFAMTNTATPQNRNGIVIATPGDPATLPDKTPAVYGCDLDNNGSWNGASDGQNIAANWLSWADLSAFLDWAALRSMSELEYEKVCRGTTARVANETANGVAITGGWYDYGGTTSAKWLGISVSWCPGSNMNRVTFLGSGYLTSPGTSAEKPCQGAYTNPCVAGARAGASVAFGPIRVGSSAYAASTRTSSGAGYYGVLELSGNVWERAVSTDATGVTFTGALGDGLLTAAGEGDGASWPSPATAAGSGLRGGAWDSEGTWGGTAGGWGCAGTYCQAGAEGNIIRYTITGYPPITTSSRNYALSANATRNRAYGGRGVR